jgi:hypothetical protein
MEHILVPLRCPVLGVTLALGDNRSRDCSPSLDRVDPARGYVPGNVMVISNRANQAKSDLTCVELEAVVAYCRLHQTPERPDAP